MSQYARGRRFEWVVRDDLEANGYDVSRAAGSKGAVDIFAVKPGQVLFVQAKINGKLPPAERVAILRLAAMLPGTALPILAYRPIRGGVAYAVLTGPGAKDRRPWHPDEVNA